MFPHFSYLCPRNQVILPNNNPKKSFIMMKKTSFLALLSLAALLTFSCGKQQATQEGADSVTDSATTTQASAPSAALAGLTLLAPDGTQTTLGEVLAQSKVTYVDVWASWCRPCCEEIPHLAALAGKMADVEDLQFISISVDEDEAAWMGKLSEENPLWPQYRLDEAAQEILSEAIQLQYIPRFLLLDSEGGILDGDSPRPSADDMEAYFAKFL